MRTPFIILFVAIIFVSCKDAEEGSANSSMQLMKLEMPSKVASSEDANYEAAAVAVDSAAVVVSSPQSQTKIIKTADLRFQSTDLNTSYENLKTGITKYKAIIQNDESGKTDESVYRNLTIRIPSQHFDSFIADISKGVQHFDRKEISQQDVTEEYVDTESRMKSKKKLEERYLQLLAKATKVSEMMEIEKKLAEIREEIEAKEGQLKYMQNRVSMSTINIQMYTYNASESGATVSYGGKIWNSIKEGFNGLSNFMLSIISIWPFILIFVGVFAFIKRRFFKKKG
ncbi:MULTISPECIES: DUF4349 domain-containing protein [Flavobacterium]|uniref:DUF4349 domain-containing protein n=1 Tax=Flavobacterium hankyongi TaxID=1176532 RepID=A0ABP8ZP68_9FLAO|nr:DUF4349 domain-containing protein [Flavobacterium sp. N1846]